MEESRLRKKEDEDERRRRSADDGEDSRLRKADRDEERERSRQQKLQNEEYRKPLTWNQLPPLPQLSKHLSYSYSFQNSFYQLPFHQLRLPASVPAHTRAPTSAPAPQFAFRRSSPISTLLLDREILKRFFDSKIQDQPSVIK
jgi:hypothetical protein